MPVFFLPLYFLSIRLQINFNRWTSHPNYFRNPIWLTAIYFTIVSSTLWYIIFSMILTMLELMAIGLRFEVDGN